MTDITECHGQCRLADVLRIGVLIREIDTLRWMDRAFYFGDKNTHIHIIIEGVPIRIKQSPPLAESLHLCGKVGEALVKQMLEERLTELHSLGVWMPDEIYPPESAPVPVPENLELPDGPESI